jgi:hypothetical protein
MLVRLGKAVKLLASLTPPESGRFLLSRGNVTTSLCRPLHRHRSFGNPDVTRKMAEFSKSRSPRNCSPRAFVAQGMPRLGLGQLTKSNACNGLSDCPGLAGPITPSSRTLFRCASCEVRSRKPGNAHRQFSECKAKPRAGPLFACVRAV